MHHQPDALHPSGAGISTHVHRPVQRNTDSAADIAAQRPFHAVLCVGDYWQMQEHRQRCEELGGTRLLRLAHLSAPGLPQHSSSIAINCRTTSSPTQP